MPCCVCGCYAVLPKRRALLRNSRLGFWYVLSTAFPPNNNIVRHSEAGHVGHRHPVFREVVFGSDHGDNFGEQGWQYHFANVTDAGTRVPLFWLRHERDVAGVIDMPISTRDVFGALLREAGDPDPAFFSLVETPECSLPIMQAYWYNNRGRTHPRFRYNQFAFIAGAQRFVHR